MSQRKRTRCPRGRRLTRQQRINKHIAEVQQSRIKYTKPRSGFTHLARTQVVLRREPNVGKVPKHNYAYERADTRDHAAALNRAYHAINK